MRRSLRRRFLFILGMSRKKFRGSQLAKEFFTVIEFPVTVRSYTLVQRKVVDLAAGLKLVGALFPVFEDVVVDGVRCVRVPDGRLFGVFFGVAGKRKLLDLARADMRRP